MRVSRHESPTGSISQVTREVPSVLASSLHSAVSVCTRRRGGSASRTSPSASSPGARGWLISNREPGVHSDVTRQPNWYLLRIPGSVIASHRRSGVVRM